MHMARILDPSRGPQEYSLANLTKHYEIKIQEIKNEVVTGLEKSKLSQDKRKSLDLYKSNFMD